MFTPVESAVGALLIQFATTQYLLEAGRIVGLSSIIGNAVFHPSVYPVSIVVGLILSNPIAAYAYPQILPPTLSRTFPIVEIAGFLVGFGTNWGSGCTSGHMLCGLSLLRVRSFVATIVFSAMAMFVVNWFDLAPSCGPNGCLQIGRVVPTGKLVATLVGGYILSKVEIGTGNTRRLFTGLKTGFLFGLGLLVSGMANPGKPQGFLALFTPGKWDPSLAMIILFAILPNIFQWRSILNTTSIPANETSFELPTSTQIPPKFLIGNAIFGIGWGLAGVCPGPGYLTGFSSLHNFSWLAMFFVGRYVGNLF